MLYRCGSTAGGAWGGAGWAGWGDVFAGCNRDLSMHRWQSASGCQWRRVQGMWTSINRCQQVDVSPAATETCCRCYLPLPAVAMLPAATCCDHGPHALPVVGRWWMLSPCRTSHMIQCASSSTALLLSRPCRQRRRCAPLGVAAGGVAAVGVPGGWGGSGSQHANLLLHSGSCCSQSSMHAGPSANRHVAACCFPGLSVATLPGCHACPTALHVPLATTSLLALLARGG